MGGKTPISFTSFASPAVLPVDSCTVRYSADSQDSLLSCHFLRAALMLVPGILPPPWLVAKWSDQLVGLVAWPLTPSLS